jgi:hypothetical protein
MPLASSTQYRLNSGGGLAFVAMDTIDTITDHLLGIIGTDRRMTRIQRYLNQDNGRVTSSGDLDITTGLTLSTDTRYPNGIHRWTQSNPVGKGLAVYLGNGIGGGVGIAAYEYEAPTEDDAAKRYHGKSGDVFDRREDVTVVRTEGTPGQPRLTDRITVEHWNTNGVAVETTLAFETNSTADTEREFARELLDVVAYGREATAAYWATPTVERACQILNTTPEQAREEFTS